MGYENELNERLKDGCYGSPDAGPVKTQGWRLADQGRRPVSDLANGAVGFRLMGLMAMERFDGRETDECR